MTLTDQLIEHAATVSDIPEDKLRANLPRDDEVWTFTFGSDHPLAGSYVQVPGDADTSRELMCAVFGPGWSTQYRSPDRAIDYGMREIPFPGEVA